MKTAFIFLAASVVLAWSWFPHGPELYVSPAGSDANPGTKKQPFLTLEAARNAARQLPGEKTIFIREGVYELAQTLKLEAKDSGETWRAYKDEHPLLLGGHAITNFTVYKGDILKAEGLTNARFHQLYFEDKRQPLARYPNYDPANPYGGGWAYVDGKPVGMGKEIPGENKHTLNYRVPDARHWEHPENAEVFIYPRYNWWNNIVRVKSQDAETRTLTLANDCSYAIRPFDRYYVQNVLEELDSPGEWYLDRKAGTLYFWPPSPLAGRPVYVPTLRTLLEIGPGACGVKFLGLRFEGSEGDAIVLKNTTNCLIAASTIWNAGDYNGSGVNISGGVSNGVAGCDIHDIGSYGVNLSGGDRITLSGAGNYADNNYIHHVGVYYKQGVGVFMTGCGLRASHNLIHDGPRMGIMFWGNNIVVEYNHLHDLNLETDDTGAIYTGGRDWIGSRGSVVRYNFIHDMQGYGHDDHSERQKPSYCWGIYLDDNTGGVDVIGNVVTRCSRAAIHLHNGRDNVVENNIFVNCGLRQVEYNGWTKYSAMWTNHLPTMIKGYDSVSGQPAWAGMRNMGLHPNNAVLPDGTVMAGNVLTRNIVSSQKPEAGLYRTATMSLENNRFDSNLLWQAGQTPGLDVKRKKITLKWADWQKAGEDEHSLVADPGFVNPAKDDYRLASDSPAYKLGFQKIPLEKIGPYRDNLRASWPILEAGAVR